MLSGRLSNPSFASKKSHVRHSVLTKFDFSIFPFSETKNKRLYSKSSRVKSSRTQDRLARDDFHAPETICIALHLIVVLASSSMLAVEMISASTNPTNEPMHGHDASIAATIASASLSPPTPTLHTATASVVLG